MLLDADGQDPVELHLSCPDAELDAAVTLAEVLDLMHVPVRALAKAAVGGPAVAVYAAADRRLAHPRCVFRLGLPRTSFEGTGDQLATAAQRYELTVQGLAERLAEATGRPLPRVQGDLRTGRILTAAQALEYGLVHELALNPR
jgi:ATP-dependent Clp protease, protease subunit